MKERLTGAIILVALIVLLVPELLTGPVRSTSTAQPAATGSSGEPPLRSYTIDLADDARTAAASGTSPPSSTGSGGPGSDPVSSAATEAKPPSISEGPAQPTSEPSSTAVQPGEEAAPAQEAKVAQPTERPVPIPQPVKPQPALPTPRTGPPQKRVSIAAAPRASAPPAAPEKHAAATPAPAAGGWLVQLGVFASRANADRLAEELKGKGFKVSVSEVTGKGKTLYRVHSAALSDRAAAQDLAAKLHAAGASSAVMPRT